jgi:hypothetical protein
MTPDQVELMRAAARTLIAHHEAGRIVDPYSLEWAWWTLHREPLPDDKRQQPQETDG